jgi:two-component system chemotaxis response regulator CheB
MALIRVLIVDDSAFLRRSLARLLAETQSIEVVGAAADGEEGLRLCRELRPDVVTLDVQMPVLDGLAMLKRLMAEQPARVVMLSSQTTDSAAVTLDALSLGAIDFVAKPAGLQAIEIGRVAAELAAKIAAAAGISAEAFANHCGIAAQNQALACASESSPAGPGQPEAAPGAPAAAAASEGPPGRPRSGSGGTAARLVVLASSTGGPSALQAICARLPASLGAAVAIVQHMPAGFTASLAARLDAVGPLPCLEATADRSLTQDEIVVAAGDTHLLVSGSGHVRPVRLPPVHGVRPAADVTLQAAAPIFRQRLLCVVLTGMGCDGCDGARAVKRHGGSVIAQDAATATIYGMPAAVAQAGLADSILPLARIPAAIVDWCRAPARSRSSRREPIPQ